jgi:hypothetical protein
MADNGPKRDGVPLGGKDAYDQSLYSGPDAAYDTAIAVNSEDEDEYTQKAGAVAR